MGLLTGPHHTSFSDPSSFTIRLSSGERPVLAPEYAVSAPVEVIAEPVSYTRASSYRAATEGLAIYVASLSQERLWEMSGSYNRNTVVIKMSLLMKLLFYLRMFALGPLENVSRQSLSNICYKKMSYSTPPGCRLVLLTLEGLIMMGVVSELE